MNNKKLPSPFVCLMALFLLLFTTHAIASLVFQSEGKDGTPASLRLFNEPCTDQRVLFHLQAKAPALIVPRFQRASLFYAGKKFESCWIAANGYVYSIDEVGEGFQPIPAQLFQDDSV